MHLKVTTYKKNAKEKIRRHKKRLEVGHKNFIMSPLSAKTEHL